jgi:hypothetical protein
MMLRKLRVPASSTGASRCAAQTVTDTNMSHLVKETRKLQPVPQTTTQKAPMLAWTLITFYIIKHQCSTATL